MGIRYIYIFPTCQIVIGYSLAAIIDFDSKAYYSVPKDVGLYLQKINGRKIKFYQGNQLLMGLLKNKIAFISKFKRGIDIKSYFLDSSSIKHFEYCAVLEMKNNLDEDKFRIKKLISYNFKSLELLFSNKLNCNDSIIYFNEILNNYNFINLTITFINISGDLEVFAEFINKFESVSMVIIYNANEEKTVGKILHKKKDYDFSNLDIVSQKRFIIHKVFFNLSLIKNNYHYGHFFIDKSDNIYLDQSKNIFINNFRISNKIDTFQKLNYYWNINKDKIHVCKDCEYRYICTDCRAYLEDPEDILSKPLKCGYNPYTGEWSEWSTNPLKQKAIDFYGMRDMVNAMNSEEKKD